MRFQFLNGLIPFIEGVHQEIELDKSITMKGASNFEKTFKNSTLILIINFIIIKNAVIFLNEKLVPAQIFGGILVVGGVLLVNLNLKNIKRFSKKDKKAIETTN